MSVSTINNNKPSALLRRLRDGSVAACAIDSMVNLASASLSRN